MRRSPVGIVPILVAGLVALTAVVAVPPGTAAPSDAGYVALAPARVLETRPGESPTVDGIASNIGLRAAGSTTELQVVGRAGVPNDAAAVVLNVTVTGPQGAGFVTVFPCGDPRPNASSLNYTPGQTVPNAVIAKIGAGGKVCLFVQSATHLLADLTGYSLEPQSVTSDPLVDGLGAGGYQSWGSVLVHGGDWLGGNGVDVLSNGGIGCFNGSTTEPKNACSTSRLIGGFKTYTYQCVELIERLIAARGWGPLITGNASALFRNADSQSFDKHPVGDGYLPVAGDMIVWGGGSLGFGHVAVVEALSGGVVRFVEQNSSPTGRNALSIDGTGRLATYGHLVAIGYLHARANTETQSSTPAAAPLGNLLVVHQGNDLYGKAGLNATYTYLGAIEGKVRIAGNRIAVLTSAGALWAKDTLTGDRKSVV